MNWNPAWGANPEMVGDPTMFGGGLLGSFNATSPWQPRTGILGGAMGQPSGLSAGLSQLQLNPQIASQAQALGVYTPPAAMVETPAAQGVGAGLQLVNPVAGMQKAAAASLSGGQSASSTPIADALNRQTDVMKASMEFGWNPATVGLGLQAGMGVMNGILGFSALGQASDEFNFQKRLATENYGNTILDYNTRLEDRYRSRHSEKSDAEIEAMMAGKRLKKKNLG